jgi:hypothetical protein
MVEGLGGGQERERMRLYLVDSSGVAVGEKKITRKKKKGKKKKGKIEGQRLSAVKQTCVTCVLVEVVGIGRFKCSKCGTASITESEPWPLGQR